MPFARLFGLAVLLMAEVGLLTLRFSTESLDAAGARWWADTLWRWKVVLPPLAIAVSTAGVMLGGNRLRAELGRVSAEIAAPRQAWPWIVAHLVAFALFAWLTAFVLEGGFATSSHQPFWAGTWLVAAGVTLLTWAAAVCTPRILLAVIWRARALVAIGVVVGTMAWAAGLVTEGLWDPLQRATMSVVAAMVHLVFADAVFVPAELIVGTQRFWVRVASTCAGYEGIGLIWVFLSAYLVACRHELRFPRALLLIPIGTVVVWVANALRLVVLIAIGTWISEDIAMGGFHAYSGSLLFSAVALAMVHGARRSSYFTVHEARPSPATGTSTPTPTTNLTAAYLLPFLAIVVTQMLAGAVSTGASFDVLYPLRVVAAGAALVYFRHVYRDFRWTCTREAAMVGVLVFVVWLALEPAPDATKQAAFAASLRALPPALAALWLVARVVGSVVTVPIAEELAFRGYLGRRLIDADDFSRVSFRRFSWTAFLVSSALFGVMHGRWLAGTLAGMCYALVLYRRGELGDAIGAHAVSNALIAVYVLATGSWLLW